MSTKQMLTVIVATLTLGVMAAQAAPQTTCPIMGGKINKKLFVDANGKRIYVCCEDCVAAVKANPEKVIKEMEAKGVELEKVKPATHPQTTCPIMGGKVNKSLYVDAEGKRIYVCCQTCINAVKANPKKIIKKMEAEGIELEKVPAVDLK